MKVAVPTRARSKSKSQSMLAVVRASGANARVPSRRAASWTRERAKQGARLPQGESSAHSDELGR